LSSLIISVELYLHPAIEVRPLSFPTENSGAIVYTFEVTALRRGIGKFLLPILAQHRRVRPLDAISLNQAALKHPVVLRLKSED
jgi:hypothetical protein